MYYFLDPTVVLHRVISISKRSTLPWTCTTIQLMGKVPAPSLSLFYHIGWPHQEVLLLQRMKEGWLGYCQTISVHGGRPLSLAVYFSSNVSLLLAFLCLSTMRFHPLSLVGHTVLKQYIPFFSSSVWRGTMEDHGDDFARRWTTLALTPNSGAPAWVSALPL